MASCGVALCAVAMCCLSSLDSLGVKLKGWVGWRLLGKRWACMASVLMGVQKLPALSPVQGCVAEFITQLTSACCSLTRRWCACYRRKHFVDEAPFPATSPPPPRKAAAAAAAAAGKGGKGGKGSKPQVQLAADAQSGRPGSLGEQFIASWHGKQGSLREQFGGGTGGSGGGGSASGTDGGAAAASEQGSPTSSPHPSRLAAGSPQSAAAAAASRAEQLGSRCGSTARMPSSPQGRGNCSSSAAARDVETANRAELLSSPAAASSKGSSSSPAARGGKSSKSGGGGRLKGLFKLSGRGQGGRVSSLNSVGN